VHSDTLASALTKADIVFLYQPEDLSWDIQKVVDSMHSPAHVFASVDAIVEAVKEEIKPGDHILVMSNGAFGGIHEKLIAVLDERQF
jgi:UDP-N-acetylmuramate: L-alanyl-gamma-D-glutamyl-meso-diaminopimelate ligase